MILFIVRFVIIGTMVIKIGQKLVKSAQLSSARCAAAPADTEPLERAEPVQTLTYADRTEIEHLRNLRRQYMELEKIAENQLESCSEKHREKALRKKISLEKTIYGIDSKICKIYDKR